MSQYITEVIDLHILIEALFARAEGSSAALMQHFDSSFTMVTTTGFAISVEQVSALFNSQIDKQLGLQIEVSNVVLLAEWENGAAVSYCETHQAPGQPPALPLFNGTVQPGARKAGMAPSSGNHLYITSFQGQPAG
ncbi:hypothetical protein ALP03_00052 [Pseudomonas amygdali pv. tabaci]|uniref:Uncharacterized protein n=1 Tax=Pseudomonas amygdali pv. tabaci TaxID=322 RepID=A0A3M6HYC5_PSEAJ|nr:hypothetical protein ALP03_00052 [Pseudomonas amygdali pv. tabaci]